MSIHIWRCSTEADNGAQAEGYSLYIELFGLVLEIVLARVAR